MKLILLFGIVLFLLFTPIVSAGENAFLFEKDEAADLKVGCYDNDDKPCDSGTACFITIISPTSSTLINNQSMTYNSNYFNYSLNDSINTLNGEYSAIVSCYGTVEDFTAFNYKVTPNGEEPSTAQGILYIGLFIALLVLLIVSITGIINQKNVYVRFTILHISYMIFTALLFVVYSISSNFLPSITFLGGFSWALFRFFLYVYFIFVIGTIIWMITELRKINVIKNMMEKGVPEDEAITRAIKNGRGRW